MSASASPAVHCPTCLGTWGAIATYQCDGPPGSPHPRVRTVPGPPPQPDVPIPLEDSPMPTPPRVTDPSAWSPAPPRRLPVATVTEKEATYAAALISDWRTAAGVAPGALSPSQLDQLRAMLMGALADARDGATLPGERVRVDVVTDVEARLWRDLPEAALAARRRLWTRWASDLATQGLRPLGWPTVVVSFRRYRDHSLDPGSPRSETWDPFVDCDENRADLVRLSIGGLAVRR